MQKRYILFLFSMLCTGLCAGGLYAKTADVAKQQEDETWGLGSFFGEFDKSLEEDRVEQTRQFSHISVRESTTETEYTITINLPGYAQEDIKVNVSSQESKAAGLKKTLELDATKKVETKDGVLKINLDLPTTIDEENYKMTFDDGVVTLVFSQTKKEPSQKKHLEFTK